ncbi:MAG: sensor domain-containing diguanylate cyclase [Alphaproteobacteria bacterium]|jgi:diguanylate cyclase (GGDEF)-like protein/PAS domain S-box-containing protein|nr:sensor domain-containing diguanylate cyclase [Alphaproteobacteria bacterium]
MQKEFLFPHNLPLNDKDVPAMFEKVFEIASEPMIILDQVGKIVSVNPSFYETIGYNLESVLRKNISFLFSGFPDGNGINAYEKFLDELIRTGYWHNKIVGRKKSGGVVHFDARFLEIKDEREYGKYYVGVLSSISNFFHREGVEYNPLRDSLTSAYNVHAFSEFMERTLLRAKEGEADLSLLVLNVDRFSEFNEKYGLIEGDKVLCSVADVLRKNSSKIDYVARLKDDNFGLVISSKHSQPQLEKMINAIFVDLCEKDLFGDKIADLSFSIGVACHPNSGEDVSELIKSSVRAMKVAKNNGGNQVVYNKYL